MNSHTHSSTFMVCLLDAYIHFEQAGNILSGNYGHNPGEISAPSSSILWPFLLAPLTARPFFEWLVLFLNLEIVIAIIRMQYYMIVPIFFKLPEYFQTRRGRILIYLLLISLSFIPSLILLFLTWRRRYRLSHVLSLLPVLFTGRWRQSRRLSAVSIIPFMLLSLPSLITTALIPAIS